jgi:hypothetical protein
MRCLHRPFKNCIGHSRSDGELSMNEVYRKIANEVLTLYQEKDVIPKNNYKDIVNSVIRDLESADFNCKISKGISGVTKTKSQTGPKCNYKIFQNAKFVKLCGQNIKGSYTTKCDRHAQNESAESPERYLRGIFGDLTEKKCIDITDKVRETENVNLTLNSHIVKYRMFVILEANSQQHAVYFGSFDKARAWSHQIICLYSGKSGFDMDEDAITKVCKAIKIPPATDAKKAEICQNIGAIAEIIPQ